MVRWSFLILGLALVPLGWYGYRTLHTPRPLSLEEARRRIAAGPPEFVRLRARPAAGPRLYNLVANPDVAHRAERLSHFSPRDGVPLEGPGAPPPREWESFLGLDISADAALSDDVLTLSEERHAEFGGLDIHSVSRQFLARLSTRGNLWVLSPTFDQIVHDFLDDADADDKARAWASGHHFKGVLHRLRDYRFENLTFADIESKFRDRPEGERPDLAGAWLIVETESACDTYTGGWHFYVPVDGSDNRIWVQVPLAEDEHFAAWQQASDELTGVWRPAGSHEFAPDGGGVAGGVALLQIDPKAVERFQAEQWQGHWGRFALWGGVGLLLLSASLFVARRIRRKYFQAGVPAFLEPYKEFLVHESATWRMARFALGCLALVVTVVAALFCLVSNDALRSHRYRDVELPYLEVGFWLSAAAWPVALGIALRMLGRGGVTVLRSDPRPPLLYLRSFAADAGLTDRWQDFLALLFAGIRYETYETSLAKAVADLGPLVAVGQPGEMLPPLGSARLYVRHDRWQQVVGELAEKAQLIVLRVGRTEGFWWEVRHLAAAGLLEKVVFYLPKKDRGRLYRDFCADAEGVLPGPLPDDPGGALFLGFPAGSAPRLYGGRAGSALASFRRLLTGYSAPAVREALNPVLRRLGLKARSMPLRFREWFLLAIGGFLLLVLLGFGLLLLVALTRSAG